MQYSLHMVEIRIIQWQKVLGNNGYFTNVMHSNNESFWNRDMMYQSLNIDKFYDVNSYTVTDENSVNWGLKDIPFFEQSVDINDRNATTVLFTYDYINESLSVLFR